jgi:outer membrane protein OmpA-like peptidoglycan-associated protein
MNTHILQGVIAFVLWSVISIWYYVNHIKDLDEKVENTQSQVVSQEKAPTTMTSDTLTTTEEIIEIKPVNFSTTLLFELNNPEVINKQEVKKIMNTIAELQSDVPYSLKIIGHTCNLGSMTYNDSLGKVRAEHTLRLLKEVIHPNIEVTIMSEGEKSPIAPNDDENRAKNRRVEINLTNK